MKKIFFYPAVLVLFLVVSKNAMAAEGFTVAKIIDIKGTGQPGDQGEVKFEVTYMIQPCTQTLVGLTTTTIPPFATSVDNKAVAVVIKDLGRACMGPTIEQTQTLQIAGPVAVGGVLVSPIQP